MALSKKRLSRLTPEEAKLVEVICAAMKIRDWNQTDLSQRMKNHPSHVARLLGGMRQLRVRHVARIGQALGLSPNEIFQLAFPPTGEPWSLIAAQTREALGIRPADQDAEHDTQHDAAPAVAPALEADSPAAELERALSNLMERSLARALERLG